jgi:gliding motility-associated-like protein
MAKDFNNIIKNKLEFYQATPSPELFDRIKANYPKRNLIETLKHNKYQIIGGFAALAIIIMIILNTKTSSNIPEPYSNNTIINTAPEETETDNETVENSHKLEIYQSAPNVNTTKMEENLSENIESLQILNINIFENKDIMVCGSVYESNNITDFNNIILPDNINLIKNKSGLSFISDKPGKYLIKYFNKNNNTILQDSMYINYTSIEQPEFTVSADELCYGEELLVSVKNNTTKNKLTWDVNNAVVKAINNNNYKIAGLYPGSNNIKLILSNDKCFSSAEKHITVYDKVEHKYSISPNYCSGSNASMQINIKNYLPNFFILDDKTINNIGKFEGLNSGIHTIKINYGSDCYFYDTIFISDMLNLNPYFTTERDAFSQNKYQFRNQTKIDDKGYESNNEIKFIWTINEIEFSQLDNPTYEFTELGSYEVMLTAKLNNKCISTYSKTIIISEFNFSIPNIFTPNGDGISDYFEITYDGKLANYNIVITNVNGEKVFESNNINKSWDGKIHGNNDAAEGNYYYIITGEDTKGNKINQTGFVQLIRR